MDKKICFDMDGTIADLYGDKDWLSKLHAYNPEPYANAKPLVDMKDFAKQLNRLQEKGYKIVIISWLAKNSNKEYDKQVKKAKQEWLKKYIPSVNFNEINIVSYGINKSNYGNNQSILFDDEKQNRENWVGKAYDQLNILEILKGL